MRTLANLGAFCTKIRQELFPALEEVSGPLTDKHQQVVLVLELVRVEDFLPYHYSSVGRPAHDRVSIARSFIAKAVLDISTTLLLIDRLHSDVVLRRICGYARRGEIPDASTFSRAFAEFATSELPTRIHKALIQATLGERIIGHIARDSTAIEAREKPVIDAKVPQEKSANTNAVVRVKMRHVSPSSCAVL